MMVASPSRFAFGAAFALCACTFDFDAVGPQPSGGGPADGGGGSLLGGANAGAAGAGAAGAGGAAAGGGGLGGESIGGAPATCDEGTCRVIPSEFSALFSQKTSACASPVIEGGIGVNGALASCNCSCVLPQDVGCADLSVRRYNDAACGGVGVEEVLAEDACTMVPAGTKGISSAASNGSATGACVTDAAPPTVPPWSFDTPVWGCPLEAPQDCGGGQCVPSGACIYSETAISCPEGFTIAPVIARASDVVDTRTCTCACGSYSGACSTEVELFGDTGCLGALTPVLQACWADLNGEDLRGLRYAPTVSATCGAATPQPFGGVSAPTAPLLCCAP